MGDDIKTRPACQSTTDSHNGGIVRHNAGRADIDGDG